MSVLWYGLESLGEIARAEVEGAAAAVLGRAGWAWRCIRPKVVTAGATAIAAALLPPYVVGRAVIGLLDAYAPPGRPVYRWPVTVYRWSVTVDGEEVPPPKAGEWRWSSAWRVMPDGSIGEVQPLWHVPADHDN